MIERNLDEHIVREGTKFFLNECEFTQEDIDEMDDELFAERYLWAIGASPLPSSFSVIDENGVISLEHFDDVYIHEEYDDVIDRLTQSGQYIVEGARKKPCSRPTA